jgi:tetratricopeptide (TPR) repeat protein
MIYHDLGKFEASLKEKQIALDLCNKKLSEADMFTAYYYYDLSNVISLTIGMTLNELGRNADSKEKLDSILRFNEGADWEWLALRERGIARRGLGDYVGAIEDLNASIKICPSEEAYRTRGSIHLAMGKESEAEEDFRKADLLKVN